MEFLWRIVARIVSHPSIARWIIRRAQRTPYFHLEGYMRRWWLFNPYAGSSTQQATATSDRKRHGDRRWPWLPSVRIHHILRADNADHPHDHPWDARTIILEGGYFERRHAGAPRIMRRGDTAPIRHGDFHHIEHVTPGGVWTLFITWDYQGSWGFLVNGKKVPWRVYEATSKRHAAQAAAPVGVEGESVLVGNLPTMNQDGYPGLGEWWVQLWRGDEIIARVYGDGPDEVRSQAQDIADALNQQPAAAPVSEAIASLPALWRQREDNGEERGEYDVGFETASDECARMLEEALAQQRGRDDG